MSDRSPSDLRYSLCSGFPEGEVISAERRLDMKMGLGKICLSMLSSFVNEVFT